MHHLYVCYFSNGHIKVGLSMNPIWSGYSVHIEAYMLPAPAATDYVAQGAGCKSLIEQSSRLLQSVRY